MKLRWTTFWKLWDSLPCGGYFLCVLCSIQSNTHCHWFLLVELITSITLGLWSNEYSDKNFLIHGAYVGLISISLRENLTFYQNPSIAKIRFEGSTKNRILVLSIVWSLGEGSSKFRCFNLKLWVLLWSKQNILKNHSQKYCNSVPWSQGIQAISPQLQTNSFGGFPKKVNKYFKGCEWEAMLRFFYLGLKIAQLAWTSLFLSGFGKMS